jgi:UDP-N-acetylglucosamine 2-epimerase
VGANTILDTVRYALQCINNKPHPDERYAVVTTHRIETIYSRSRLLTIVALLERIAEQRKVLFVLHEPTRRQLARFKLDTRLARRENIELMPLQSYLTFVNLLAGADFVITDGGSIQEECYYLNVPCLIMRAKTERQEGLNENARLANFDQSQIDCFLQTFSELRREPVNDDLHPAEVITDYLLPWV